MLCFLCGKKIGFMRSLFDQHYCCAAHRHEARMASANALRDEEEIEPWAVARSKEKKALGRPTATAGQTASIFAFLTVGGLLVAALMLPGPSGGGSRQGFSLDPVVKPGFLEHAGSVISEVVRDRAPITLHHDFSTGLRDWTTVAMN